MKWRCSATVELLVDEDGSISTSKGYRNNNDTPMPIVRYTKELNGALFVVEAVGENSWERLWLVSAYMQKKTPASNSQGTTVTQTPYAENQPLGNVRNANASPVNSSISTPAENVNTKFSLLPSRNVLNAQIAAHMARMNDASEGAVPPDSSNTQQQSPNPDSLGERQFAAQRSEAGRCFQAYMGCSPVDALIRHRLQKAHGMLHDTTRTLQEISHACGFSSVNYFSRQFRRHYGYAPSRAKAL